MAGKYRTMTLIEEGELERLRQRQLKEYNPGLKSLVSIQDQIEKILNDPEFDDESKHKVLCHLQEKFGYLYKKFQNSAANIPVLEPLDPAPEDAAPAEQGDDAPDGNEPGDPFHLINLPHVYQHKLHLFKDFLEEHKEEISVNANNELVLDGLTIPNSSMTDLIRSFYLRNQNMNLIGLANFLGKLRELKVNPHIFSHKDAKNSLKTLKHKASQKGAGKAKKFHNPLLVKNRACFMCFDFERIHFFNSCSSF